MQCRSCGTEIADKALVCYKCGTATTESTFKARPSRTPRSSAGLIASILALVLLALFAVYMQRMVTAGAPNSLRWLIVAFAVAIVALRAFARRTGR